MMNSNISDLDLRKLEIQLSNQKEYRDRQERYAYYMLSLAASCIAGTVVFDKSLYDLDIKNSIFYLIYYFKYI